MKITKKIGEYGEIRYENEKGRLHREDGPAEIYPSGNKYWYKNGKVHREDGPAGFWQDEKEIFWVLNGGNYSFEGWCRKLNKTEEEKILLKMKYFELTK